MLIMCIELAKCMFYVKKKVPMHFFPQKGPNFWQDHHSFGSIALIQRLEFYLQFRLNTKR